MASLRIATLKALVIVIEGAGKGPPLSYRDLPQFLVVYLVLELRDGGLVT
ncbi:MAG: hypothetical protein OEZ41_09870 [Nitrospirota bacterium]|nr:hypothetical protein [Nitrospirota bacterium]MDH5700254.1 hypothetical protein [Nitrospirota bacterium]